jgi:flagellin
MAFTINTNIPAINAQRYLGISQGKMNTAMQRLGSGSRINSAKDDAAGMAIATRFTTQINGLAQARRNASDGISMAQTTEAALDEVTNNLQRIRELALQATNGSNSINDRKALNAEVQQRLEEITRIATQTNFNGMKVLDGSGSRLSFQVGANVGEVIGVSMGQGMRADQVGQLAHGSVELRSAFVATPYAATQSPTTDWTAANGQSIGAKDYDGTSVDWSAYKGATVNDARTFLSGQLGRDFTVKVNGSDLDIQRVGGEKLVLGKGDLAFATADGEQIEISGTFGSVQGVVDAINAGSRSGVSAYVATDGSLQFNARSELSVSGAEAARLGFATDYAMDAGATLAKGSVLDRDSAYALVASVDATLESVSAARSALGAVQNRFESTIRNLDNIKQNLTESRSAITDSDMASETGEKTMAMILQQSGVSVLAQANSSKQLILKLLE